MRARAVVVVLDGLPNRHVGPRITPVLDRLAREGGRAVDGGRAVLTTATYPNHASLVTGCDPGRHGITANFVATPAGVVAADDLGPATTTLFDELTANGLQSAAVYGDQHLVGVTNASAATAHWPPNGVVPDDVARTTDGYVADESTVPQALDALAGDPDLLVAQLNDPDTAGHAVGPDTTDAAEVYHATDARLADVVDALRPRWDETLLVIVSDHDQVPVTVPDCVDLWSPSRAAGLDLVVIPEGQAAVVSGEGVTSDWLHGVDGVVAAREWYAGTHLLWSEPGRAFGWGECLLRGIHGGPSTAGQVAVVSGGHPAVATVARSLASRRPDIVDWAPTVADVLGVPFVHGQGRSLALA